MPARQFHLRHVGVILLALAIAHRAPAAGPTPDGLRQTARGPDPVAALAALKQLESAGDAGRVGLPALVRELMTRDAAVIEKWSAVIDPAKLKPIEAELAAERAKARDNLAKLDKGDPVTRARTHQIKLRELLNKANVTYAQRWLIIDALRRRAECAQILERLGEMHDDADLADKALAPRAERALGIDVATAMAIPEPGAVDEPHTDAAEYPLWFHRACRRIEAYDKTLAAAGAVNRWEAVSVRLLNDYREQLGLFPLEIDPRLCDAARRHSKEMVDLKYFNHASPTAGQRQPVDRMRNAGYAAGWRENICANVGDPERAFALWFNSPGHHIAMTAPDEVAIGCGRWDNAWTHTFGHGLRLSRMDGAARDEALKALVALGPVKPQPDDARLPPVTVTRVETDITIIDPKTGQRITLPGTTPKK